MKYQVLVLRKSVFNMAIIKDINKEDDCTGWELVGEARTLKEAREIKKTIPNLIN